MNVKACSYSDLPARDLSAEARRLATEMSDSWFATPDFATLYGAADQAVVVGDDLTSNQLSFYTVQKYLGMFRTIRFAGPARCDDVVIRGLMRKHKAQFATVPFVQGHQLNDLAGQDLAKRSVLSSEDFVVDLASSMEEYLSGLGRTAQKHLPYYVRRLEREYKSRVEYVLLAREQITFEYFTQLVYLNHARMKVKGSRSLWKEEMVGRRWTLAKKCGLFTGICLDGRLVAGTVCYVFRDEAYLVLIAHNPEYNALNLGNVCLLKTVERIIKDHCARLHLMWGESFYKRQFGGRDVPLLKTTIFRHPFYLVFWHGLEGVRLLANRFKPFLRPIVLEARRARSKMNIVRNRENSANQNLVRSSESEA